MFVIKSKIYNQGINILERGERIVGAVSVRNGNVFSHLGHQSPCSHCTTPLWCRANISKTTTRIQGQTCIQLSAWITQMNNWWIPEQREDQRVRLHRPMLSDEWDEACLWNLQATRPSSHRGHSHLKELNHLDSSQCTFQPERRIKTVKCWRSHRRKPSSDEINSIIIKYEFSFWLLTSPCSFSPMDPKCRSARRTLVTVSTVETTFIK